MKLPPKLTSQMKAKFELNYDTVVFSSFSSKQQGTISIVEFL